MIALFSAPLWCQTLSPAVILSEIFCRLVPGCPVTVLPPWSRGRKGSEGYSHSLSQGGRRAHSSQKRPCARTKKQKSFLLPTLRPFPKVSLQVGAAILWGTEKWESFINESKYPVVEKNRPRTVSLLLDIFFFPITDILTGFLSVCSICGGEDFSPDLISPQQKFQI